MHPKIELVLGDITSLKVDAVVNAANSTLLGGGGVDGAIHRVAGHKLLDECKLLNGCKTGEAKITKGYNLPAKKVIHTVGPIWQGGLNNEYENLTNCYVNALKLASANKCKSIAFPAISTGVYRFPKHDAAKIAINTVVGLLNKNNSIKKVFFVIFDSENYEIYAQLLKE